MLADLTTDQFKRIRASYVIAADGGSSSIRGQLGVGFGGRTYSERWIVIDTKVLEAWPGHDRLRFHCNPARPTVDCPTPLGHPVSYTHLDVYKRQHQYGRIGGIEDDQCPSALSSADGFQRGGRGLGELVDAGTGSRAGGFRRDRRDDLGIGHDLSLIHI